MANSVTIEGRAVIKVEEDDLNSKLERRLNNSPISSYKLNTLQEKRHE